MRISKEKLLVQISAGLLALSAVFLWQAYRVEHRVNTRKPEVQMQTPFLPAKTVEMGAAAIVTAPIRYEAGNGTFAAPAGKQYAVITLTIKNRSDKPLNVLPTADFYMKSTKGDVAYESPFTLAEPLRAGELLPGDTIKGEVSFLVTEDIPYLFYIDAIWSGSVLPFAIQ